VSILQPIESDIFASTTRINDTWHLYLSYDGNITSAELYHVPTGLWAAGHAKRLPEDEYNAEIGATLAYFRALERVSHKILRKASRGTI